MANEQSASTRKQKQFPTTTMPIVYTTYLSTRFPEKFSGFAEHLRGF
jgi:hypothetical protein